VGRRRWVPENRSVERPLPPPHPGYVAHPQPAIHRHAQFAPRGSRGQQRRNSEPRWGPDSGSKPRRGSPALFRPPHGGPSWPGHPTPLLLGAANRPVPQSQPAPAPVNDVEGFGRASRWPPSDAVRAVLPRPHVVRTPGDDLHVQAWSAGRPGPGCVPLDLRLVTSWSPRPARVPCRGAVCPVHSGGLPLGLREVPPRSAPAPDGKRTLPGRPLLPSLAGSAAIPS